MNFISFFIVKETVILKIKTFYMSLTFEKEANELSEIKKKLKWILKENLSGSNSWPPIWDV